MATRIPAVVGLLVVAATLAILLTRPDDEALLRGVKSGGWWAEHHARMLTIRMWGSDHPPLELFAQQTDTLYPPFLHWTMGALGALTGHGEVAVGRAMTLWLVLLAFAAGLVARCVTGSGRVGWLVVATTVCVPALASLGLVYYYDLPMTALLWAGLGWLLLFRPRSPTLAGVGAGVFWFLAAITKWTALPFGAVMLAGGLLVHLPGDEWSRREAWSRVRAALAISAAVGLLLATWSSWTTTSWSAANSMAMGEASAPGLVGRVVRMLQGLQPLSLDRLAHYPASLATLILSPIVAVLVLSLTLVWLARDRRGAVLVGFTVLGQWAVLLLLIPTQNGRFLITLAPALVIAAVFGLECLPRRVRLGAAGVWLAVSLLVVVDVQHGELNTLNQRWSFGPGPHAYRTGRGLSIDSADPNTGWRRADMLDAPFSPGREVLWGRLMACGAEVLVFETGALRDFSDRTWWEYRNELAAVRGEPAYAQVIEVGDYATDDRSAVLFARGAGEPCEVPRP